MAELCKEALTINTNTGDAIMSLSSPYAKTFDEKVDDKVIEKIDEKMTDISLDESNKTIVLKCKLNNVNQLSGAEISKKSPFAEHCDGEFRYIEIPRHLAQYSKLWQTMLKQDRYATEIDVDADSNTVIHLILEYLVLRDTHGDCRISNNKPVQNDNEHPKYKFGTFDLMQEIKPTIYAEFILNIDLFTVHQLLCVSSKLDIPQLTHIGCARIGAVIRDKTVEGCAKIFADAGFDLTRYKKNRENAQSAEQKSATNIDSAK